MYREALRMIYECYLQLRDKAGERQIKNPKLGLTHNQGGQPPSTAVAASIQGRDIG
jgi:acetyl-CoA C-acetyltransferase